MEDYFTNLPNEILEKIKPCLIEFPNSIIDNYYEYHNLKQPND